MGTQETYYRAIKGVAGSRNKIRGGKRLSGGLNETESSIRAVYYSRNILLSI